MKRVAVTGLGIVAPGGSDPDAFFASLVAGRSSIGVLRDDWAARLGTRIAARATFDGSAHFRAQQLRMLDRVSQLALVAAKQAIESAGIEWTDESRASTGVFLGPGMGGSATTDEGYATLYRDGSDRINPFTVLTAYNGYHKQNPKDVFIHLLQQLPSYQKWKKWKWKKWNGRRILGAVTAADRALRPPLMESGGGCP